jgi:hypothetical protein
MSKSFAQAPKPPSLSADVIAAFERGGPGQDTRAAHMPTKPGMREPTNVESIETTDVVQEKPTKVGTGATTNVQRVEPTKQGVREPTKAGKGEPTRRLSIDLPVSWHRRFKTACSRTDKKMLAEVMDFIKRRTVELEKE